jgi:hypothetical protein
MKTTPFRERQLQDLLRIVCNVVSVQPRSLIYGGRSDSLVFARLLFYYSARSYLGASYPAIGMVANRDHTTIMSGVKTVQGRIDTGHRPTLTALGQVRGKLFPEMSQQTKTTIKCARCKKTDDDPSNDILPMVLTEQADGSTRLERFDQRIGGALVSVGPSLQPGLKHDTREALAADLCDQCVKVINETLDPLTSRAAEHGTP